MDSRWNGTPTFRDYDVPWMIDENDVSIGSLLVRPGVAWSPLKQDVRGSPSSFATSSPTGRSVNRGVVKALDRKAVWCK